MTWLAHVRVILWNNFFYIYKFIMLYLNILLIKLMVLIRSDCILNKVNETNFIINVFKYEMLYLYSCKIFSVKGTSYRYVLTKRKPLCIIHKNKQQKMTMSLAQGGHSKYHCKLFCVVMVYPNFRMRRVLCLLSVRRWKTEEKKNEK